MSEVIKKKKSRKKENGRSVGFSSFNARIESIKESKPTFKASWHEGKRCVFPSIISFKERPDSYRTKEFTIELESPVYMTGIYDTWTSQDGEKLNSCTLITLSGRSHRIMDSIPHTRMPFILSENSVEDWLSESTTPNQALEMINQYSADKMSIFR